MSVGSNPRSEAKDKDTPVPRLQDMGATTASSDHHSSSPATDSAATTTDASSVRSEPPESKTVSDPHVSRATLPPSTNRASQKPDRDAQPCKVVPLPKDLNPKSPYSGSTPFDGTESQPLLLDEATLETEHSTDSHNHRSRFDLTMLNPAVTSLYESNGQGECLRLLHNEMFDSDAVRAKHPKEFDDLEIEGSPIKPGILDTLALIDVCLKSNEGSWQFAVSLKYPFDL
jgi:hypothetical protein